MLILLMLIAGADGGQDKVALQGTAARIVEEAGRWGGMAPRPGEFEERQRRNAERRAHPQPLAGVRFLVLPGTVNADVKPAAEFVPDAAGHFSLKLSPGQYCVVEASRRVTSAAGPVGHDQYVDQACVAALQAACEVIWTITGPTDASFVQRKVEGGAPACWHGPSPPSAAPRR